MRRMLIVAAIVVAVATGCGSDAPDAGDAPSLTTTSPAAPPTTVTTTTEAVPTRAQAAKRYLRIVAPYNRALEKLEQAVNSGRPMPELRSLAKAALAASRSEMRQLRAAVWPTSVRGVVGQLANAIEQSHAHWRQATKAQSGPELVQAIGRAAGKGKQAAVTIRKRLDLERYDEGDYG